MKVRAKFKLSTIERSIQNTHDGENWILREVQTLGFHPVFDGSEENKKFWEATPNGKITLICVNEEAWKLFNLGEEYYIDFIAAAASLEGKG